MHTSIEEEKEELSTTSNMPNLVVIQDKFKKLLLLFKHCATVSDWFQTVKLNGCITECMVEVLIQRVLIRICSESGSVL